MLYLIALLLIAIAYFIGKFTGNSEGETRVEERHYFLYAPQIDSYEQGYKDGVRKTKDRLFAQ